MEVSFDKCCVGVVVNSECFKKHFTTSTDLILLRNLPTDTLRVIQLRVQSEEIRTICAHHYAIFFDYYDTPRFHFSKNCCDPFNKHTKRVVRGIKKIDLQLSDNVFASINSLRLIPGKTLCPRCSTQLTVLCRQQESSHHECALPDDFDDNVPADVANEDTFSPSVFGRIITPRRVISALSNAEVITPISDLDKSNAGRRSKLCAAALDNLKRNMLTTEESFSALKLTDYSELLTAVKNKIDATDNRSQKLSLLTLAPASWTHRETSEYFGVSEYAASQAENLKTTSGVLATPAAKRPSRQLTEDAKLRAINFYLSDEYSRQLPGMKNVKSVRQENGKRIKMQKRLLLLNIDELHAEYIKKFPNVDGTKAISFSAFADLRPKHVITVGSSGTHSVCVCIYHQNVKLMLSAIGLCDERHLLMDKVVCSVYNKVCMMTRCPSCPGSDALESFLENLFEEEDENVSYKQWTHTDGNKLENIIAEAGEFIEKLVSMVNKLTTHHLISRNQSAFFVTCKNMLDHESVVLVSDFSENYSFVIQDSVQGYYWANDQATILPFMAYMKRPDGSAFNVSMAIISDHLTHDTVSVHAYLNPVLEHIKTLNPFLKRVKYFTDGSGAQYKNKKNFANLCAHFDDFQLEAEWHFFASCHGKSACDGIGGTIKRLARLASLQRGLNDQITTPKQLFDWATGSVEIKCFYVTTDEVKENETRISERMQSAIAIRGTRSFHCYVPINLYQINASILSGDEAEFATFDVLPKPADVFNFYSCAVDDYLACIKPTNKYWYVTQICSLDEANKEFNVILMSPGGESGFAQGYKPTRNHKIIPLSHVLVKITTLKPTTVRNRLFKLEKAEHDDISNKYTSLLATLE